MTVPDTRSLMARDQMLAHMSALRRLKSWTRDQFGLGANDTVLIEQGSTDLPGFPQVETTIAFWTGPECRHEFKVFKPAIEVEIIDLPPGWMRDVLKVSREEGCTCC